jgi:hypothetical protein
VFIATPPGELVAGLGSVPVHPERIEALRSLGDQIGVSTGEPERTEREWLKVGARLEEPRGLFFRLLEPVEGDERVQAGGGAVQRYAQPQWT